MIMDTKLDFLYLSEPDMVKAGVTDMHRCIEVMCEMFDLMGQGDYLMGGKNGNSHGLEIVPPEESPFPNMPVAAPDRRFMAMPAYLGGRFNVAGVKWYGSNIENRKKGLPRSILTVILNDADTGAPLSIMSGNLVSSMRTGAIPGVGAKYLANEDSEVVSIIGAGVIGKSCLAAIVDGRPGLKKVKIYDVFEEASQRMVDYIERTFPGMETEICATIQDTVKDADIVNVATSGAQVPYISDDWLKDGVLLTLPAEIDFPKEFVLNTKKVLDNKKMHIGWEEELEGLPGGLVKNIGLISANMIEYVNAGEMSWDDVTDIGEIIAGNKPGRTDKKEKIIFAMGGMPVEDVAWGYEIYQKALEMGLGINLDIWEEQYKL